MGSVSPAEIMIPMPDDKSVSGSAAQSAGSVTWPENRLSSRLKMVDLALRTSIVGFLVVSLCAMLTSTQSSAVQLLGMSIPVSIKWTRTQPFEFLVVFDALACMYSLLQFIYQSLVFVRKFGKKKHHMWFQLGADQACAYFVLSAAAAAAGASRINKAGFKSLGVNNLHIPAVCSVLNKFCNRATIAIIFTFLAAFASACCVGLDLYFLSL